MSTIIIPEFWNTLSQFGYDTAQIMGPEPGNMTSSMV